MKKKIITIVAAIALLAGVQASAQNNNTNTNGTCTKTEQNCKAGKSRDGRTPRMNSEQRRMFAEQAFDGIQLTDAQKAGLKALNEQQQAKRAEMKAQKESAKAEAKQQRKAQDSTMRAARSQSKRDYLNGVKAILTPDQYVVFLENIVVEGPAHQDKLAQGPRVKDGKQFKDGKNMNRKGDKGRRDAGDKAGKAKADKNEKTRNNG